MASVNESRLMRTIAMAGSDGQTGPIPVTAQTNGDGGIAISVGSKTLSQTVSTPGASYKLRDAAKKLGMQLGFAFDEIDGFVKDANYAQLLRDESDVWTSANSMKDSRIWTAPATWDFSAADAFVALAATNGKPVRGHVLMYPDHPPAWQNSGTVTSANWQSLIDAHMAASVSRYPNLIGLDVVNEMFVTGSTYPWANGYKDSVWLQAAQDGDAFMAHCFRRARAYAPNIPLFYCDNATEQGNDTARNNQKNNIVAALTRLKAQGVPIDGFSAQWHIIVDRAYQYRTDRAKHRDFLKALVDLGLIINITEIDVRMPTGGWSGSSAEFDSRAAELLAATLETYFAVVPAAQRQHISFWEGTDKYNAWRTTISGNAWGDTERPCPFDSSYNRKSMYTAALQTLLGAN